MGKLQIFLEQDIAKMTSTNTVDLRRFGFNKIINVSLMTLLGFKRSLFLP